MNSQWLQSADFIDSSAVNIKNFAKDAVCFSQAQDEKAVALYYRVRDEIRDTPYLDFSDPEMYRASSLLHNGYGFCISKASLLAACGRALGIPSRVSFADISFAAITATFMRYSPKLFGNNAVGYFGADTQFSQI